MDCHQMIRQIPELLSSSNIQQSLAKKMAKAALGGRETYILELILAQPDITVFRNTVFERLRDIDDPFSLAHNLVYYGEHLATDEEWQESFANAIRGSPQPHVLIRHVSKSQQLFESARIQASINEQTERLASIIRADKSPYRVAGYIKLIAPLMEHKTIQRAFKDRVEAIVDRINDQRDLTYWDLKDIGAIYDVIRDERIKSALESQGRRIAKELAEKDYIRQRIQGLQQLDFLSRDEHIQKAVSKRLKLAQNPCLVLQGLSNNEILRKSEIVQPALNTVLTKYAGIIRNDDKRFLKIISLFGNHEVITPYEEIVSAVLSRIDDIGALIRSEGDPYDVLLKIHKVEEITSTDALKSAITDLVESTAKPLQDAIREMMHSDLILEIPPYHRSFPAIEILRTRVIEHIQKDSSKGSDFETVMRISEIHDHREVKRACSHRKWCSQYYDD